MKTIALLIALANLALLLPAPAAEILEDFEHYDATRSEWKPPRQSPWRLVAGTWVIAEEKPAGKVLSTGTEDVKGDLLWLPNLDGDENTFSFRLKFQSEFLAKDGAVAYLRLGRVKDGSKRYATALAIEKGQFVLIHRDAAAGGSDARTVLGDGLDANRWYAVRVQIDPAKGRWRASVEPPGKWSEWMGGFDASLDGVDGLALYQRHMVLSFDDFRAAKIPVDK